MNNWDMLLIITMILWYGGWGLFLYITEDSRGKKLKEEFMNLLKQ